jgi:hypothetical protein
MPHAGWRLLLSLSPCAGTSIARTNAVSRSRETGVPDWDPSGRSHTRPPLIRWGQGGDGEGYDEPVSTLPSDN